MPTKIKDITYEHECEDGEEIPCLKFNTTLGKWRLHVQVGCFVEANVCPRCEEKLVDPRRPLGAPAEVTGWPRSGLSYKEASSQPPAETPPAPADDLDPDIQTETLPVSADALNGAIKEILIPGFKPGSDEMEPLEPLKEAEVPGHDPTPHFGELGKLVERVRTSNPAVNPNNPCTTDRTETAFTAHIGPDKDAG